MSSDFFKFPSTPHLATLSGVDVRGDKVMSDSERTDFLNHALTIEEKMDGANLGISFDSDGNIKVQNRGAYLFQLDTGQWKHLDQWLESKMETLFEVLADQFILFGEWCFARHSVFYHRLPDWFLGFDIYDKKAKQFLSTVRRGTVLDSSRITQVPVVGHGRFRFEDLVGLLSTSKFSQQQAEGLYLRADGDDWLLQRAKLVRPAFVQSMVRHWSRTGIIPNRRAKT